MIENHKTTIGRLLIFMQYKNLNDNKITKLAGLSVGLIGRARRNKTGLHTETIEKILLVFPELNPTWLLTGMETMLLSELEENYDIENGNSNIKNPEESLVKRIFDTQREVMSLLKKKYFKEDV